MTLINYIPVPTWLLALFIFSYVRNLAAKRNDARRERLSKKEEWILTVLRKKAEVPTGRTSE